MVAATLDSSAPSWMPWSPAIGPLTFRDPRQALAAHYLTWAAEQARLTASVVDLVGAIVP
jgi:hypothetical protein